VFFTTACPKDSLTVFKYVASKNSKKLELFNPKDGSLVANDVELAGAEDVDAAVAAAEKAFPAWKKISAPARQEMMNNSPPSSRNTVWN
jgi:aldehyde dehydrogenase (NAD+)